MVTRLISKESEQELFNNMKYIYSSKLPNAANNENSNLPMQNKTSIEEDTLMVKWVMDHFLEEHMSDGSSRIIRLTHKMKKYGFHISHCIQALLHRNGNYQKALELLFCKYYEIEDSVRNLNFESTFKYEKSAEIEKLKLTYGNAFSERVENYLWTVQLKLPYLKNDVNFEEGTLNLLMNKNVCNNQCNFVQEMPEENVLDQFYTLEIRFPEGCKYPYEPPYFYFYKNDRMFPDIKCLRIARRLYDEALIFSFGGIPSISSVISLLKNDRTITNHLADNTEEFLNEAVSLFQEKQNENVEIEYLENMNAVKNNPSRINRNKCNFEKQTVEENNLIESDFIEKQRNLYYIEMLHMRMSLPAWSCQSNILNAIQKNQVVIISGETGCGKSTQVPQFILDDWITNRSESLKQKVSCLNIICTQPRRISAVGIAERVAAERIEYVGNTIGYHIRLERRVSSRTRVTFCTLGILLQILAADTKLLGVTHIIVDEVHERSADSDFLLMLLKDLISKKHTLKVILMSATIKADTFSSYFGNVPVVHIPGKTFPVEQIFLEDLFEKTEFTFTEDSRFINKSRYKEIDEELNKASPIVAAKLSYNNKKEIAKEIAEDDTLSLEKLIDRYPGYKKLTYKNLFVTDYKKINFDLIEKTIEWIVFGEHSYTKCGSILVFLPGINEISTIMDQLLKNHHFSDTTRFVIIPLHSSLSNEEQNRIFTKTASYVCKIVLSTNLAETSITIEDCVYVIDTGTMKEIRFNPVKDMESLEICWVSHTNVMQRMGRAGRVMPGVCIHLYTSYRFQNLFDEEPTPEVLRISLEQLVLRIYLMHRGKQVDLHKILAKMIDSPTDLDITSAMQRLQNTGALDSKYVLTPLGHHLAKLPVNVRIGKLILFGAIFCCLDSALTIAACLSYKTPFNVPFEKRGKIRNPKLKFLVAHSDHLTVLEAYNAWLQQCAQGTHCASTFAAKNFLSVHTLRTLADLKYQFLGLLVSIGFVDIDLPPRQRGVDCILNITGPEININNKNYKLLQGLLCAALYPNIARVYQPYAQIDDLEDFLYPTQRSKYRMTFLTRQDETVYIHPSSVNSNAICFTSPYLVYHEKIKTSKVFISEVSMISILSLILFSGYELSMMHNGKYHLLSLDSGWVQFPIESYTLGLLLQQLRKELTKLLEQKMENPLLNILNHHQGKRIIDVIVQIVTRE